MSNNVPQSDQMRASGSGRRKVALPPGRSQLDWVRNSKKLHPPVRRSVTLRELKRHKSRNDAWLAISGKVFDVTPYIEYHPGGIEMILVGAGKDATILFNKYHAWVNPEFMLHRCFIGMLDTSDDAPASQSSTLSKESDTTRNNVTESDASSKSASASDAKA